MLLVQIQSPLALGANLQYNNAARANSQTAPLTATNRICDDVYFVGARGSTESALGDNGMGPEVGFMGSIVQLAAIHKGLSFTYVPVSYPALNPLNPSNWLDWYLHGKSPGYIGNIETAVLHTQLLVQGISESCPQSQIILAGYSSGAMAMHVADLWLAKYDAKAYSHIKGVLLLGDGYRALDSQAKLFGSASLGSEGLAQLLGCHSVAYLPIEKGITTCDDVPNPTTTAEIANAGDVIAAQPTINPVKGYNVHVGYILHYKNLLSSAAIWITQFITSGLISPTTGKATIGQPVPAPVAALLRNYEVVLQDSISAYNTASYYQWVRRLKPYLVASLYQQINQSPVCSTNCLPEPGEAAIAFSYGWTMRTSVQDCVWGATPHGPSATSGDVACTVVDTVVYQNTGRPVPISDLFTWTSVGRLPRTQVWIVKLANAWMVQTDSSLWG